MVHLRHLITSTCLCALALGAQARTLELGGLSSVQQQGTRALDDLDAEYARVAAALSALRHA